MKLHKYTIKQLKNAVKISKSIRSVLIKLNVAPYGGNYDVIKKAIKEFKINTSHFTGQLWSKGRKIGPRISIEDYLANKRFIISIKLKKRLIKEGFFESKCYKCNLTEWLGEPIPIELHHKDGNRANNNLKNLTILCSNCHALTDNYRGKNK